MHPLTISVSPPRYYCYNTHTVMATPPRALWPFFFTFSHVLVGLQVEREAGLMVPTGPSITAMLKPRALEAAPFTPSRTPIRKRRPSDTDSVCPLHRPATHPHLHRRRQRRSGSLSISGSSLLQLLPAPSSPPPPCRAPTDPLLRSVGRQFVLSVL